MELLRSDPSLMPTAIDELIRYASPVWHFRRTAAADTELRGVQIRKGERVVVWFAAANRDPEAFPDPAPPRPHAQARRARRLRSRRAALLPRRAPRAPRDGGAVRAAAAAHRVDRAHRPARAPALELHERPQAPARAGRREAADLTFCAGRLARPPAGNDACGGEMTESERLAALERDGVRIVRVTYPDLHGVLRGKDVPIAVFASTVVAHGLGFCKAISTVDLQHNVVAGFEHGFRDIHVTPLPETLVAAAVGARGRLVPGRSDRRRRALRRRSARRRSSAPIAGFARARPGARDGPRARVLPARAQRDGARAAGRATSRTRRTSTRSATTPIRAACSTACCSQLLRRRARRDRRRARVRHEPVGDQPRPLARARRRRSRVPLQGRRQGPRDARGHARDVHGQAVQRRRGLGLPPAPLALRRGRRQRLRRHRGRRGLRGAAAPLHRGRDRARTRR